MNEIPVSNFLDANGNLLGSNDYADLTPSPFAGYIIYEREVYPRIGILTHLIVENDPDILNELIPHQYRTFLKSIRQMLMSKKERPDDKYYGEMFDRLLIEIWDKLG